MAVNISHPYYPRTLLLPHYIENNKTLTELLGVFFGIIGVFLLLTWKVTGSRRHLQSSPATRLKVCWFMACGLIHLILEGYFSVKSITLAGEQTFLAQMWKEYGKADSRYVSDDTFTVCMEGITAFVDGPLAFLAVHAFMKNTRYRYVAQLLLSLCQLYGDILYFLTAAKDGFIHSEMWHPLYFWFYFVFLNSLWIIIPFMCILESVKTLSTAQALRDSTDVAEDKKKKKQH